MIRDFKLEDMDEVRRIHKENGFEYTLPDLSAPLWVVTKVVEIDGRVRAALGAWIQVELYLQLDKGDWATPEQKHEWLVELDRAVTEEVWLRGIDQECVWLPPNMERFGQRLEKDFGFTKDREGWYVYSKLTGRQQ
jgi:hypothetical protein